MDILWKCCRQDVNKKRYDTVTFLIGNREFYALVRSSGHAHSARQCTPQCAAPVKHKNLNATVGIVATQQRVVNLLTLKLLMCCFKLVVLLPLTNCQILCWRASSHKKKIPEQIIPVQGPCNGNGTVRVSIDNVVDASTSLDIAAVTWADNWVIPFCQETSTNCRD